MVSIGLNNEAYTISLFLGISYLGIEHGKLVFLSHSRPLINKSSFIQKYFSVFAVFHNNHSINKANEH